MSEENHEMEERILAKIKTLLAERKAGASGNGSAPSQTTAGTEKAAGTPAADGTVKS